MEQRYAAPQVKSSYENYQEPPRTATPNRSQSISFLAEHDPDIRVAYDEFKAAISAARDRYTG